MADPNPGAGLEVAIYSATDPTERLDYVPRRTDPSGMDEIKGPGAGSFKILRSDPKFTEQPDLFAYLNIVKLLRNGRAICAYIIQNHDKVEVSTKEESGRLVEISGEGLRGWFRNATVKPFAGLKRNSMTERNFNFASEIGPWYKPDQWKRPVNYAQQQDPQERNYYAYAPKDWPDAPIAGWMWDRIPTASTPRGSVYFRRTINVPSDAEYSIFIAADDLFDLYVDGQLVADSAGSQVQWSSTTRVDLPLTTGDHIIAIKGTNDYHGGYAGVLCAIFRYGDPTVPTSAQMVAQSGDDGWMCLGYPAEVPSWTPGEIMLTLLQEAKDRGVAFPNFLKPTFTGTLDSTGQPWERGLPWTFDVGTEYFEVIEKLEELVCDVWINPDTYELNMYKERSRDRHNWTNEQDSVRLAVGQNVTKADTTGQADIKTSFDVLTNDGWVTKTNAVALAKYGLMEGQIETDNDMAFADSVAKVAFEKQGGPRLSADVAFITSLNAEPFTDFTTGDFVLAPGEDGKEAKRRVMSLSVSEGDSGNIFYSAEFDTIEKTRLDRLERALQNISGGSRSGGSSALSGPSSSSANTPTTSVSTGASRNIPKAPVGLAADAKGMWTDSGYPMATVQLSWEPVINSVTGSQTPFVVGYEVQGRLFTAGDDGWRLLSTTTAATAFLTGFNSGETWLYRVRALTSQEGPKSSWSNPLSSTMPFPVKVLSKPTPPLLRSALGTVSVTWDGKLTSLTDPKAPDLTFAYVYAAVSQDSSGVFMRVGQPLQGAGTMTLPDLEIGKLYYLRLYAVDKVGVVSPPSETREIAVVGVDLGTLDEDVAKALQEAKDAAAEAKAVASGAQETADGRGKVWYEPKAPVAPKPGYSFANDVWFDTANGNKPMRYNGTAWVSVQDSAATIAQQAAADALAAANGKIKTFFQSTEPAPTGLVDGDLWYDDDDGYRPYRWNGSTKKWVTIRDTGITSALADSTEAKAVAAAAQTAADDAKREAIAARTSADGKTTTYRQGTAPTPPVGGFKNNDVWYNTADGNNPSTWNSTTNQWVSNRDTTIAGALAAANAAKTASDEAKAAATAAQTTADGRGRNWYLPAAPAAPKVGYDFSYDIWYDTSSNKNTPNRWNGTAWVSITDAVATQANLSAKAAQEAAEAALAAAQGAQTSANGKNKTWRQDARPPLTGNTIGDTWFDTDDGNRIYTWDGTWNPAPLGTTAIADAAITNAKIGNLDAAKITTGVLDAAHIGAGSITAEKLTLGSFDNLMYDPDFSKGGADWVLPTGAVISTGAGRRSGTPALVITHGSATQTVAQQPAFKLVSGGASYLISAWIKTTVAAQITLGVVWRRTATTNTYSTVTPEVILPGVWTKVSRIVQAPDTATDGSFYLEVGANRPAGVYTLDFFSVTRASNAELIVDGSITTVKLVANAITANELNAEAVVAGKIAAGAVTAGTIAANAVTAGTIAAGAVTAGTIQSGSITATQIASGTITADRLAAGTITATSGVIGSLDASKIVTGTLDSSLIAANSISASQLVLADLTNFAPEADSVNDWTLNTWQRSTAANGFSKATTFRVPGNGARAEGYSNKLVPVLPDDELFVQTRFGWTGSPAQLGSVQIVVRFFSKTKIFLQAITAINNTAGSTGISTGQVVAPTGAAYASLGFVRSADATVADSSRFVYVGDFVFRLMNGGELIVDGSITATHLAVNSVTSEKIVSEAITTRELAADAVTAEKILAGSITAGKLAAGAITADSIAANAISSRQVTIGSMDNLIFDPAFDRGGASWTFAGNVNPPSIVAGAGRAEDSPALVFEHRASTNQSALQNPNTVPINPGSAYRITYWVKSTVASTMQATAAFIDSGGSITYIFVKATGNLVPGVWTRVTGLVKAPANAARARFYLECKTDALAGTYAVDFFSVTRASNGELIVDGTITADHLAANSVSAGAIQAGAITAGKIEAEAVTAGKLAANSVAAVNIQAEAVTAGKLAADSVTANSIAAGSVTANKIASGAIETQHVTVGFASPSGDPVNRVPAPPTDTLYWSKVKSGAIVMSSPGTNRWTTSSVSTNTLGILPPVATEIPVTNLLPMPLSGRLSVSGVGVGLTAAGLGTQVWIRSYNDAAGTSIAEQKRIANPSDSVGFKGKYYYAYLYAVENPTRVSALSVFEVISGLPGDVGSRILIDPSGVWARRADGSTGAVLNSAGITGMNKSGGNTFQLSADTGDVTITGGTIRTNASGTAARTVMDSNGIAVFNNSNEETVRLGYGIGTGMSVRNPKNGQLTALASHVFGIATAGTSGTGSRNSTTNNAFGPYQRLIPIYGGDGSFQSASGRAVIIVQVKISLAPGTFGQFNLESIDAPNQTSGYHSIQTQTYYADSGQGETVLTMMGIDNLGTNETRWVSVAWFVRGGPSDRAINNAQVTSTIVIPA